MTPETWQEFDWRLEDRFRQLSRCHMQNIDICEQGMGNGRPLHHYDHLVDSIQRDS